MAKILQFDLPEGFDPAEYMRMGETRFLHNLSGYVQAMRSANSVADPNIGFGGGLVDILNSYQVFVNMRFLMPNARANQELLQLVECMSDIVDISLDDSQRASEIGKNGKLPDLLDSMIRYYLELEKTLETEATE